MSIDHPGLKAVKEALALNTVPEKLRSAAEIYEQRAAIYGDNYKRSFPQVMMSLFPRGIQLRTTEDFARFGVLTQLVSKLTRYASQFEGGGHADSLNDSAVYSMMLQELDDEVRR